MRCFEEDGGLRPLYTSDIRLLGLPLVDYRYGKDREEGPVSGVARGWIAVGPIAFGIVFAGGGVAVGGISMGGTSLGVFSMGGIAVGAFAMGGAAIGIWAIGALAIALSGAIGGLAIAGTFAKGGTAIAEHANDPAASRYFADHAFLQITEWVFTWRVLLLAPFVLVWLLWFWLARRQDGGQDPATDDLGREV